MPRRLLILLLIFSGLALSLIAHGAPPVGRTSGGGPGCSCAKEQPTTTEGTKEFQPDIGMGPGQSGGGGISTGGGIGISCVTNQNCTQGLACDNRTNSCQTDSDGDGRANGDDPCPVDITNSCVAGGTGSVCFSNADCNAGLFCDGTTNSCQIPTGGNPPAWISGIGNRTVMLGELLNFQVAAIDADPNDTLTYNAEFDTAAMGGATFDPITRTFAWTPSDPVQVGEHGVVFTVTDGQAFAAAGVIINVIDDPALLGDLVIGARVDFASTRGFWAGRLGQDLLNGSYLGLFDDIERPGSATVTAMVPDDATNDTIAISSEPAKSYFVLSTNTLAYDPPELMTDDPTLFENPSLRVYAFITDTEGRPVNASVTFTANGTSIPGGWTGDTGIYSAQISFAEGDFPAPGGTAPNSRTITLEAVGAASQKTATVTLQPQQPLLSLTSGFAHLQLPMQRFMADDSFIVPVIVSVPSGENLTSFDIDINYGSKLRVTGVKLGEGQAGVSGISDTFNAIQRNDDVPGILTIGATLGFGETPPTGSLEVAEITFQVRNDLSLAPVQVISGTATTLAGRSAVGAEQPLAGSGQPLITNNSGSVSLSDPTVQGIFAFASDSMLFSVPSLPALNQGGNLTSLLVRSNETYGPAAAGETIIYSSTAPGIIAINPDGSYRVVGSGAADLSASIAVDATTFNFSDIKVTSVVPNLAALPPEIELTVSDETLNQISASNHQTAEVQLLWRVAGGRLQANQAPMEIDLVDRGVTFTFDGAPTVTLSNGILSVLPGSPTGPITIHAIANNGTAVADDDVELAQRTIEVSATPVTLNSLQVVTPASVVNLSANDLSLGSSNDNSFGTTAGIVQVTNMLTEYHQRLRVIVRGNFDDGVNNSILPETLFETGEGTLLSGDTTILEPTGATEFWAVNSSDGVPVTATVGPVTNSFPVRVQIRRPDTTPTDCGDIARAENDPARYIFNLPFQRTPGIRDITNDQAVPSDQITFSVLDDPNNVLDDSALIEDGILRSDAPRGGLFRIRMTSPFLGIGDVDCQGFVMTPTGQTMRSYENFNSGSLTGRVEDSYFSFIEATLQYQTGRMEIDLSFSNGASVHAGPAIRTLLETNGVGFIITPPPFIEDPTLPDNTIRTPESPWQDYWILRPTGPGVGDLMVVIANAPAIPESEKTLPLRADNTDIAQITNLTLYGDNSTILNHNPPLSTAQDVPFDATVAVVQGSSANLRIDATYGDDRVNASNPARLGNPRFTLARDGTQTILLPGADPDFLAVTSTETVFAGQPPVGPATVTSGGQVTANANGAVLTNWSLNADAAPAFTPQPFQMAINPIPGNLEVDIGWGSGRFMQVFPNDTTLAVPFRARVDGPDGMTGFEIHLFFNPELFSVDVGSLAGRPAGTIPPPVFNDYPTDPDPDRRRELVYIGTLSPNDGNYPSGIVNLGTVEFTANKSLVGITRFTGTSRVTTVNVPVSEEKTLTAAAGSVDPHETVFKNYAADPDRYNVDDVSAVQTAVLSPAGAPVALCDYNENGLANIYDVELGVNIALGAYHFVEVEPSTIGPGQNRLTLTVQNNVRACPTNATLTVALLRHDLAQPDPTFATATTGTPSGDHCQFTVDLNPIDYDDSGRFLMTVSTTLASGTYNFAFEQTLPLSGALGTAPCNVTGGTVCTTGTSCDTATGECQTSNGGSCSSDADCLSTSYCPTSGPNAGECTPREGSSCTITPNCPTGYECRGGNCEQLINTAPVFTSPTELEYHPDVGETVTFTIAASDSNGDPIVLSRIDSDATIPAAAFDTITGSFNWTATAAAVGTHTLTFHAQDIDSGGAPLGAGSSPDLSVTIEVDDGLLAGDPVFGAHVVFTPSRNDNYDDAWSANPGLWNGIWWEDTGMPDGRYSGDLLDLALPGTVAVRAAIFGGTTVEENSSEVKIQSGATRGRLVLVRNEIYNDNPAVKVYALVTDNFGRPYLEPNLSPTPPANSITADAGANGVVTLAPMVRKPGLYEGTLPLTGFSTTTDTTAAVILKSNGVALKKLDGTTDEIRSLTLEPTVATLALSVGEAGMQLPISPAATGQLLSIPIKINTGGDGLYSFKITINFDATVLQPTTEVPDSGGNIVSVASGFDPIANSTIGTTSPLTLISASTSPANQLMAGGLQTVATVHFKVVGTPLPPTIPFSGHADELFRNAGGSQTAIEPGHQNDLIVADGTGTAGLTSGTVSLINTELRGILAYAKDSQLIGTSIAGLTLPASLGQSSIELYKVENNGTLTHPGFADASCADGADIVTDSCENFSVQSVEGNANITVSYTEGSVTDSIPNIRVRVDQIDPSEIRLATDDKDDTIKKLSGVGYPKVRVYAFWDKSSTDGIRLDLTPYTTFGSSDPSAFTVSGNLITPQEVITAVAADLVAWGQTQSLTISPDSEDFNLEVTVPAHVQMEAATSPLTMEGTTFADSLLVTSDLTASVINTFTNLGDRAPVTVSAITSAGTATESRFDITDQVMAADLTDDNTIHVADPQFVDFDTTDRNTLRPQTSGEETTSVKLNFAGKPELTTPVHIDIDAPASTLNGCEPMARSSDDAAANPAILGLPTSRTLSVQYNGGADTVPTSAIHFVVTAGNDLIQTADGLDRNGTPVKLLASGNVAQVQDGLDHGGFVTVQLQIDHLGIPDRWCTMPVMTLTHLSATTHECYDPAHLPHYTALDGTFTNAVEDSTVSWIEGQTTQWQRLCAVVQGTWTDGSATYFGPVQRDAISADWQMTLPTGFSATDEGFDPADLAASSPSGWPGHFRLTAAATAESGNIVVRINEPSATSTLAAATRSLTFQPATTELFNPAGTIVRGRDDPLAGGEEAVSGVVGGLIQGIDNQPVATPNEEDFDATLTALPGTDHPLTVVGQFADGTRMILASSDGNVTGSSLVTFDPVDEIEMPQMADLTLTPSVTVTAGGVIHLPNTTESGTQNGAVAIPIKVSNSSTLLKNYKVGVNCHPPVGGLDVGNPEGRFVPVLATAGVQPSLPVRINTGAGALNTFEFSLNYNPQVMTFNLDIITEPGITASANITPSNAQTVGSGVTSATLTVSGSYSGSDPKSGIVKVMTLPILGAPKLGSGWFEMTGTVTTVVNIGGVPTTLNGGPTPIVAGHGYIDPGGIKNLADDASGTAGVFDPYDIAILKNHVRDAIHSEIPDADQYPNAPAVEYVGDYNGDGPTSGTPEEDSFDIGLAQMISTRKFHFTYLTLTPTAGDGNYLFRARLFDRDGNPVCAEVAFSVYSSTVAGNTVTFTDDTPSCTEIGAEKYYESAVTIQYDSDLTLKALVTTETAVGDNPVAVLGRFPGTQGTAGVPTGGACSSSSDCGSGSICIITGTGPGTCEPIDTCDPWSDPTCPAGTECFATTWSSTGYACLPTGTGGGLACTSDADCPVADDCVSGVCTSCGPGMMRNAAGLCTSCETVDPTACNSTCPAGQVYYAGQCVGLACPSSTTTDAFDSTDPAFDFNHIITPEGGNPPLIFQPAGDSRIYFVSPTGEEGTAGSPPPCSINRPCSLKKGLELVKAKQQQLCTDAGKTTASTCTNYLDNGPTFRVLAMQAPLEYNASTDQLIDHAYVANRLFVPTFSHLLGGFKTEVVSSNLCLTRQLDPHGMNTRVKNTEEGKEVFLISPGTSGPGLIDNRSLVEGFHLFNKFSPCQDKAYAVEIDGTSPTLSHNTIYGQVACAGPVSGRSLIDRLTGDRSLIATGTFTKTGSTPTDKTAPPESSIGTSSTSTGLISNSTSLVDTIATVNSPLFTAIIPTPEAVIGIYIKGAASPLIEKDNIIYGNYIPPNTDNPFLPNVSNGIRVAADSSVIAKPVVRKNLYIDGGGAATLAAGIEVRYCKDARRSLRVEENKNLWSGFAATAYAFRINSGLTNSDAPEDCPASPSATFSMPTDTTAKTTVIDAAKFAPADSSDSSSSGSPSISLVGQATRLDAITAGTIAGGATLAHQPAEQEIVIDRNSMLCQGPGKCTLIHWAGKQLPTVDRRVITNNLIEGRNNLGSGSTAGRCYGIYYDGGDLAIANNTIDTRLCGPDGERNPAIFSHVTMEPAGGGPNIIVLPRIFNNFLMGNECAIGHPYVFSPVNSDDYYQLQVVHNNMYYPAPSETENGCLYNWTAFSDPEDVANGGWLTVYYPWNIPIASNSALSSYFVNLADGNYHLKSRAGPIYDQAINTGNDDIAEFTDVLDNPDAANWWEDLILDLDDVARPVGSTFDRGAYEYVPPPGAGLYPNPGDYPTLIPDLGTITSGSGSMMQATPQVTPEIQPEVTPEILPPDLDSHLISP